MFVINFLCNSSRVQQTAARDADETCADETNFTRVFRISMLQFFFLQLIHGRNTETSQPDGINSVVIILDWLNKNIYSP